MLALELELIPKVKDSFVNMSFMHFSEMLLPMLLTFVESFLSVFVNMGLISKPLLPQRSSQCFATSIQGIGICYGLMIEV